MQTSTQELAGEISPCEAQATLPAALPQRATLWVRAALWLKNAPFVAMHLGCLAVFLVNPSWVALLLCVVLYFVRMFGITAGYHRYFAHRAFKTSRVFQFLLACLGCTSMQKGPLWWASHHRGHHRHTDQREDPHSPVARSIWWSHIGWILDSSHDATNLSAVRDLERFGELRWLNRLQWLPGILVAGLCWLIDGWSGLVWGFLISTVLLFHATFLVNSVCHLWGSRRYATADASRNNWWVALFTLGEGWHNNHHHYQSSARQGFFWWEIDVTYYLIKLLCVLGLVWDIRKPLHVAPVSVAKNARQP